MPGEPAYLIGPRIGETQTAEFQSLDIEGKIPEPVDDSAMWRDRDGC